jgi:hypothetical protein
MQHVGKRGPHAQDQDRRAGHEVICVVCVAAPNRPAAVAVALAVVADALRAEDLVLSPSR